MPIRVLTRRELNRALLARQLLLERADLSPLDAIERLIGVQAQIPNPPYTGLWTRIRNFQRDDLTRLMEARQVVRVPALRSTLHLMSGRDYLRLYNTFQPALVKGLRSFFSERGTVEDYTPLIAVAKAYVEDQPRTTGELRAHLLEIDPSRDGDALAYIIRTYLPLVQVPPGGLWGSGSSGAYTTPEAWLGQSVAPESDLRGLILRSLSAYGPSSVMDMQTWIGITKLKESVAAFKTELVVYQDENGVELYDVPGAPLPSADTPAPIRFIPEYDNLLIAHADRTRILPEDYRKQVFLSSARVLNTFLVDGFVAGVWKIERAKKSAALVIQPFEPLVEADQAALVDEGERLLRFVEDKTETTEVRFA
jgi:hypothetical protein